MHQDYDQWQLHHTQEKGEFEEMLQVCEGGDIYVNGQFVINDPILFQSMHDALSDDNFSVFDDESGITQHQDDDTAEFYSAKDGRCILKMDKDGWFVEGKKADNNLDVYLGLQTWLREIGTYPQLS